MYKHIKQYEVKFTDADAYDNLKPSALLSYLEESACLSAEELGFGYDAITPKNLGFIIVNNYIELNRPIKLGDILEIHTWPLRPKHLIFLRDFELYVHNQEVGVATSRWCMVDLRTFAMAPASAFFSEGDFDNYNTERSIPFNSWKIPVVQGEPTYEKVVTYSDYDHYFHVNNAKYADFLMDTFSVEEMKGKYVSALQIMYVKQCKFGEKLVFYRKDEGNAVYVDGKVGEDTRVRFKVVLNDISL